MDPFSRNREDVYWKPKSGTLWEATPRRAGCSWQAIDDAAGVVLVIPMRAGGVFCAFGTASGFDSRLTRIKEHSHLDTGGLGWVSSSWDHWPIGWLNSQAHLVDAESIKTYPNHFSPAGMDLFAMPKRGRGEGNVLVAVRRHAGSRARTGIGPPMAGRGRGSSGGYRNGIETRQLKRYFTGFTATASASV
jgi:hypothetical protein